MSELQPWWGRGALAHYYPNLGATRGTKAHRDRNVTSCGLRMPPDGTMTRFDPETGKPWPRCKQCETDTHTKGKA